MRRSKRFVAFGLVSVFAAFLVAQCQRDPYREGRNLYKIHCANCHGENGEGLGELIPPLANADFLAPNRSLLPCILVKGLSDSIRVNGHVFAGQPMPPNAALSDVQVCNILNFVLNNWGNKGNDFLLGEVKDALKTCK